MYSQTVQSETLFSVVFQTIHDRLLVFVNTSVTSVVSSNSLEIHGMTSLTDLCEVSLKFQLE